MLLKKGEIWQGCGRDVVVIFIVVVRKVLVGKMICDQRLHGGKEDRPPLFILKGLKD